MAEKSMDIDETRLNPVKLGKEDPSFALWPAGLNNRRNAKKLSLQAMKNRLQNAVQLG